MYLEQNLVFTHPRAHPTFRHGAHDDAVGHGGGGGRVPAPVCRAWRKPRPAGGRKSERRLKPPLPRLRLQLRRQQLRRQQLRRTRLRLRTTSGASIGGEHRGRVSGAASEACIGGEHRGRHRWRPRLALLGLARLTFWLALALHRLASPRLASPRSGRLARLARLASLALASARLARLSPHPRLALPRLASLTSISSLTLALHRLARPRIASLRSPRLTRPRLGEPRQPSSRGGQLHFRRLQSQR